MEIKQQSVIKYLVDFDKFGIVMAKNAFLHVV